MGGVITDECKVYIYRNFRLLIIHFSNFHVVLISKEPSEPSMLCYASPIIQLFKFHNKSDIRNQNNDDNFSKYGNTTVFWISRYYFT